ncbi:Valyl-tRNA synthetase [hydrothermal vent metagenome]|uniref:valine--tRNA ligase n=1 Tax=hydrothermal vent metagenome TaxID=652676 RepID=A0A3B0W8G7_9ZZZZ
MIEKYNPQQIESSWYKKWEDAGYFSPSDNGKRANETFCIMLPPPNVTGSLHMGHAFQDTIMDVLIRYNRMCGKKTLWQCGTDHAGIATQMVVEKQLLAEGIKRTDMGREKFLEKVWAWKEQSSGTIQNQIRRLGASVDWENERFTLDEGLSTAVQQEFISLYEDGLIYRGKRLVNWDPVLQTALSDIEVESMEEDGFMWHLRYPRKDGKGHVIVATTRPETMLGDSAVAVHPNDERYQDLIGQEIELPLTGRSIRVIADDYVDMELGTGCVKITPAHDFNDAEMGKRHELDIINIFTDTASINDDMPAAYRGMDRFDARQQIVADFKQLGLLEKIVPHRLMVPRGDRSNTIIEPYLTDQWYVKVASIAKNALAVVKRGEIKFVPDNWSKTYYQWMENIEDWCISRQLWWGHRVPAWYDQEGKIYVAQDEVAVRKKYNLDNSVVLKQDEDVFDTWFSSALWPFSTLGWPEDTQRLKEFYPTQVLVTGFDIIFFWVARMIMMGMKFMNMKPFETVYMHGLITDGQGKKMSKSVGNVLDPLDIIDGIDLDSLIKKRTTGLMQPKMASKIAKTTRKEFPVGIKPHGCDALRFTFAALATNGRHLRFDMQRLESYRNFANKIFNASRFVLMNTEDFKLNHQQWQPSSTAELWILSQLQSYTENFRRHLDNFRLDLASQCIYDFIWNEYCDWFVELAKPLLKQDINTRYNVQHTLLHVLDNALRLLHPIMPFITEEIWQELKIKLQLPTNSIMIAEFPEPNTSLLNATAIQEMQWLQSVVLAIRQIRGEMNISPRKSLSILLENATDTDLAILSNNENLLKTMAQLDAITILSTNEPAPESAVALVAEMKINIPLAGLIDIEAEITRVQKLMATANKEITRSSGKLANEKFVNSAPEAVVKKQHDTLTANQHKLAELQGQLQKLQNM